MAQKKKKEPEVKEEYNFIPPDFNEREFLEKDLTVTKTVLITAALAVLFGIVAYLTTDITFAIGLLIIIAGAVVLKNIIRIMPLDISTVENKTWLGNGVLFFFLALGIWILLLNPPFGDTINPEISDMQVWNGNAQLTKPFNSVPEDQAITFNATVTDNGALSLVQFTISGSGGNTWNMTEGSNGRYEIVHTFVDTGTYSIVISATDDVGNVETLNMSVQVV
ncbi:MAG: hypothetical protein NT131_02810 [Methanomassiliicoccales archaeon]|nr:hypothetical protein [Methanomassiliicoccales archaeon]